MAAAEGKGRRRAGGAARGLTLPGAAGWPGAREAALARLGDGPARTGATNTGATPTRPT
jgi:hypothetical protein